MKSKIWLNLSLILVLSGTALAQTAKKTVTNDDLEKFRQKREQAEAEYRRTYKERGMPSPEELEQREQESQKWREEFSRRSAIERRQDLGIWQIRAGDLRNQIISVEAQMNYLNAQISNSPLQNSVFISPEQFNSVGTVSFGFYRNRGYTNLQTNPGNRANNVQTAINASAGNPNPFYGTALNNSGIKLVIGPQDNIRHGGYRRAFYGGGYANFGNNNSSQREELISRLRYLGQVRAGLVAQWNSLADEAHRSGVRID